ncbi:MAG TPA: cytochrome-c peroxidase [Polyangiaceae bacterium]|nr:cytochrome-c peroxidase [Polyangiaceae bacterium]
MKPSKLRVVIALGLVAAACGKDGKEEISQVSTATGTASAKAEQDPYDPLLRAPFAPIPDIVESKDNPITPEKVELGRLLYFDPRLSKNHDVACQTCHKLGEYGVDNAPTSTGHKGQRGTRNSPTVYNASLHFRQFWDGRAASLEEQAKGPMTNPVEMAMPNEDRIVETLKSMPEYVGRFEKAFPGDSNPVTVDNAAKAIGAFERKLLTPARWDAFLEGKRDALDDAEIAGLRTFVETGCQTCHSGPGMGGAMFQKLGLVMPWRDALDMGRYEVSKQDADRQVFKVPSLRNVEKTAPYYHDGSVPSLEEAVRLMGHHQLGKELSEAQIASIVKFLKSTTGPLPAELIKEPVLPASTPETPKPEPD